MALDRARRTLAAHHPVSRRRLLRAMAKDKKQRKGSAASGKDKSRRREGEGRERRRREEAEPPPQPASEAASPPAPAQPPAEQASGAAAGLVQQGVQVGWAGQLEPGQERSLVDLGERAQLLVLARERTRRLPSRTRRRSCRSSGKRRRSGSWCARSASALTTFQGTRTAIGAWRR